MYDYIFQVLFHSGYSTKTLYALAIFPMRATYASHRIHLDVIVLIMFSEE
jgi:hypothetical protein